LRRSNPSQSNVGRKMDCFVASAFARRRASAGTPRNDAVGVVAQISNGRYTAAFSRHDVARGLRFVVPQTGGSRECRMRAAPAVSRAKGGKKKAHTSIQVQRRTSDIPCAMALRLIRALPGELRSVATVARERVHKLGASLAAPGPHDFAVRSGTARHDALASTASHPNVR
jgi:hypothetical protein